MTTNHNNEIEVSHAEVETHEEVVHEEAPVHEYTLFPEPIFNIGSFTITNSYLNSLVVVLLVIVFSIFMSKIVKKIPGKVQGAFEVVLEGALDMCDQVTHDRKKTLVVFPIVFSLFIFILLNNWLGIVPGVGSIGVMEMHDGYETFVPFFRGGTADLNTTLVLALFAVIGSNIFGVMSVGAWKYFNKFINIEGLLEIPKKIMKDPTIIIVNPIKFFVGLIEIIGEIAKVASLSFRLFGNIFAGEVLLASMAVLMAFIVPIPFIFLEIIVGIIQAMIFAMLTLVYFSIASSEH